MFAVHQSAMDSATGEGRDENATRTYAYSPAMVVFLAEFIKLAFSVSAYVHTHARDTPGNVWGVIRAELEDAAAERRYLRFAVPALIYLIENHLRFVVLSRLASPITWVVFSHVEISSSKRCPFTCCGENCEGTSGSPSSCADGVMAAEIALCHAKGDGDPSHPSCDSFAAYPVVALSLVLLGAATRAAGIAVEFVYKEHFATSIHLQNAQLYAFGALANGAIVMFSSSGTASVEDGGEGEGDDGFSPPRSRSGVRRALDLVRHPDPRGVRDRLVAHHETPEQHRQGVQQRGRDGGRDDNVDGVPRHESDAAVFPRRGGDRRCRSSRVYGGESGGSSRDADRAHVLGPGSGASVFTSRAEDDVVRNATPGTPLSSRGSFAFDAPDANETKQLL